MLQEVFLSQNGFIIAQFPNLPFHSCIFSRFCRPFCWMAVAHVCQRWRAIALACRTLWTRFTISVHSEWTMELLRRSGNAPLCITYNLPTHPSKWDARLHSFAMVLGHLSRIEKLHLYQKSPSPLPSAVVGMLSGRAPLLRSLSLCGALFGPQNVLLRAAYIPGLLNPHNTPRLEYLTLSGPHNGLHLAGRCESTLKHLNIVTVIQGRLMHSPNTSTLLEVLSAAPLLETLDFERREPWVIFLHHAPLKHATLPRLYALTLATEGHEVVTVLDHLDLPVIRRLEIATVLDRVDASVFASTLQDKLTVLGAMHELIIEASPSDSPSSLQTLRFSGSATDPEPAVPTDKHSTRHRSLTLYLRGCDAMQVAGELCQRIVLNDVRSLEMQACNVSAAFWSATLQPMRSLVKLTVSGSFAAIHLPEALHPEPHGVGAEGAGNVSTDINATLETLRLPALRSLQLSWACLERTVDYDAGTVGAYSGSLCASLRARREAGARLEELRLDHCYNVNEATMSALRDVVEGAGGRVSVTACDGTMDSGYWDAISE